MRSPVSLLLLLALASCRRTARAVPDAARGEESDVFAPGALAVRAACRAEGTTWFAREPAGVDAGDGMFPVVASAGAAVIDETSAWGVWTDTRDSTARVARVGGEGLASAALGAGDQSDATLVLAGARRDVPVVVWARDASGGRTHEVRSGARLDSACTTTETRDEALAVSAARVGGGVLVAWDEDGPAPVTGSVKVQVVRVPIVGGECGAARQVSPADQDAGDPVVASVADGSAVIFWLSAHDVDALEHNDTVTDIWGIALDATGAPRGSAVRVTTTQGHRFGLSAAVSADGATVWLAYRMASGSGIESRGDGGQVALVSLSRGQTGLTRAGDAVVMSAPRANPTGAPRVFARAGRERPAEVWWRERREGAAVVSMHRAVDATGRAVGDARAIAEEPGVQGELPVWMDANGAAGAVVVRTAGGGVGMVRVRCAP